MRRLTLVLLALAWLAVTGQPAQAQTGAAQITGFRLSDSASGAARTSFPSGTRVIYAILDYTNMNNTPIGVEITDPNGVGLYNKSETVSGNGSKTFEISGPAILNSYQNLTNKRDYDLVIANLNQAIQTASKSAKIEYGKSVVPYSNDRANASRSLSGLVTDTNQRASLNQAATSFDQVSQLGQELAFNLPDDQLNDNLSQMKTGLDSGMSVLAQTLAGLGDGSSLYFPDGAGYLANALLDDFETESIEWTVGSGATPTPTATAGQAILSPTPTATTPVSQPTATQPAQPTATQPTQPTATPLAQPTATRPAGQPTATLVQPTATRQPAGQTLATATEPAQPTRVASTPTIPVSAASTAEATTPTVAPTQAAAMPATATGQMPAALATADHRPPTAPVVPTVGRLPSAVIPTPAGQPTGTVPPGEGGLPLGTVSVVGGAIALGLIALWFRRKM
jgi:hypothetical protein